MYILNQINNDLIIIKLLFIVGAILNFKPFKTKIIINEIFRQYNKIFSSRLLKNLSSNDHNFHIDNAFHFPYTPFYSLLCMLLEILSSKLMFCEF